MNQRLLSMFLLVALILSKQLNAAEYLFDSGNYLRFHWKGDLQSHSVILKVFPYLEKLKQSNFNTFLILYTKSQNTTLENIRSIPILFSQEEYPVSQVNVESLIPMTTYFYTFVFTSESEIVENDFMTYYTVQHPQEFSFKTFNMVFKPYSFTFGASSCAQVGSTSPVFLNLTNENLDFFIHMGDLHYSDIDKNDTSLFYQAYYQVFNSQTQKEFFQSTPIVYNWDDHDFGSNDAIGTSPSKPAVTAAYKNFVPHSPLKNYLPSDDSAVFPNEALPANTDPKAYLEYNDNSPYGIFRSFIVGRCLFIIMDLRSFQDIAPGDMLGDEQKTWLENQLRFAGNNQNVQMVFIISSIPWIDEDKGALWEDFTVNQEWIGDLVQQHIKQKGKQIMLIAGDAHMMALDDGRNNRHGGFPVVQAASLDQRPSCKGGPYSHGFNTDRGQYAVIKVTDSNESKLCVKVSLKRYGVSLINYDTCKPEMFPASEVNHCPSKLAVLLRTSDQTIYIIIGSIVAAIIFALTIWWYRRKYKSIKNTDEIPMQQKYNLASEELEMDDFKKEKKQPKNKKMNDSHQINSSAEASELEFHGSI